MNSAVQVFVRLWYALPSSADPEEQVVARSIAIVIPVLAIFTIVNLLYGFMTLFYVEALMVLTMSLTLIAAVRGASASLVQDSLLVHAILLFCALTVSPSLGNTGIFWVLTYPFVAYLLKGVKQGVRWILAFIVIDLLFCLLLFVADYSVPYSPTVLGQFATVFVFISLFALIYEVMRETHNREVTQALENLRAEVEHHKQTRGTLQATESYLETILHCAPVAIWTEDGTGKRLLSNDAFAQMARGANLTLDDLANELTHRFSESGQSDVWQYQTFRGTALRSVEVNRAPVLDIQGRPDGFVGLATDITARLAAVSQRNALNRRMEQAQRLESLGLLAGGIAHDFNNHLSVIMGSTHIIGHRLTKELSDVRPDLDRILQSSRKAADLCRQMLSYAGKGNFSVRQLNIGREIASIEQLLRLSLPEHVRFHLSQDSSVPDVLADGGNIEQIVFNLVSNAGDAIGRQEGDIWLRIGRIEVNATYLEQCHCAEGASPGTHVFVEVRDNGPGMEPDTIARIFDPFFTTREFGRGLGLSAVLGILRAHHGALRITTAPGQGCAFVVLLPAVKGASSPIDLPPATTPLFSDGNTIIIADQDDTVRNMVASLVQQLGYSVTQASSRADLKQLLRSAIHCGALILDHALIDASTLDPLKEYLAKQPNLRLLLFASDPDDSGQHHWIGLPIHLTLHKPFMPSILKKALSDMLATARS